ncbi:MAG: hypothetical protein WA055_03435 [Candidatus Moraniibacteriota bacterium]
MSEEKTYKSGEVMSMLEQINGGIEVIGEQHGEIVKNIKSINGRLDSMQNDITEIKHKLSEKVDREEFNKLENRVVKMEKLILAKSV